MPYLAVQHGVYTPSCTAQITQLLCIPSGFPCFALKTAELWKHWNINVNQRRNLHTVLVYSLTHVYSSLSVILEIPENKNWCWKTDWVAKTQKSVKGRLFLIYSLNHIWTWFIKRFMCTNTVMDFTGIIITAIVIDILRSVSWLSSDFIMSSCIIYTIAW